MPQNKDKHLITYRESIYKKTLQYHSGRYTLREETYNINHGDVYSIVEDSSVS